MSRLKEHFDNIKIEYGDNCYVQIPNGIFRDLNIMIKEGSGKNKPDARQSSFSYSYLVTLAFLYKYGKYVDIANKTYVQNSDLKIILGYSKKTKSIDKIIKGGGLLDVYNLTENTNDYPIDKISIDDEVITGVKMKDFLTINDLEENNVLNKKFKDIVKNRNYQIKVPKFMFEYKDKIGAFYDYENSFRINLDEFIKFIYSDKYSNIDFYIYSYIKSQCYPHSDKKVNMALDFIYYNTGIESNTFYRHLNVLKENNNISVKHRGWAENIEEALPNTYTFIGI